MSNKRAYFVMLGFIFLLCAGLVGATFGVNKLLTARSSTLTGQKAKSMALDQEKIGLQKAKKQVKEYTELEKIVKSVVPEDKDQAEGIRELVNIAAANGVKLAALNFPASTLGTGAPGVATTTTPSAALNSPSAKTNSLSQLQPVKTIPGVYSYEIIVQSDPDSPVTYSKFIGFLSDLEHNRRTAQVSAISLQPSKSSRSQLTFSLTLEQYIKP